MSRQMVFALYFAAVFAQAGAYGLTFMLPRLFDSFGASEKVVGVMLFLTALSTLVSVYFSGHLSDLLGRLRTLGAACVAILVALFLYGTVTRGSALLFMVSGGSHVLYVAVALLFALGYGASYPILVAMAANDAEDHLGPQTPQLFALSYFVGIFGFPLVAGWMIVELGPAPLLALTATLALIEAFIALKRSLRP